MKDNKPDNELTIENVLKYIKSLQEQDKPIEKVWYDGKQYDADEFLFAVTGELPPKKYYCAMCSKFQPDYEAHYCG